jgi:hypothetical protein
MGLPILQSKFLTRNKIKAGIFCVCRDLRCLQTANLRELRSWKRPSPAEDVRIWIRVRTPVYIRIRMCTPLYVQIRMRMLTYKAYTYGCVCVHTRAYTYGCVCVHTHAYTYGRICVHAHAEYVHMHSLLLCMRMRIRIQSAEMVEPHPTVYLKL